MSSHSPAGGTRPAHSVWVWSGRNLPPPSSQSPPRPQSRPQLPHHLHPCTSHHHPCTHSRRSRYRRQRRTCRNRRTRRCARPTGSSATPNGPQTYPSSATPRFRHLPRMLPGFHRGGQTPRWASQRCDRPRCLPRRPTRLRLWRPHWRWEHLKAQRAAFPRGGPGRAREVRPPNLSECMY